MGNEKGDVREAAGILSVIKCRKGAHDGGAAATEAATTNEAHDLNTMMATRRGHCRNIVTFRGISSTENIAAMGGERHPTNGIWSGVPD